MKALIRKFLPKYVVNRLRYINKNQQEEMLKELIIILTTTQVLTCQDLVGSNVGVQQAV